LNASGQIGLGLETFCGGFWFWCQVSFSYSEPRKIISNALLFYSETQIHMFPFVSYNFDQISSPFPQFFSQWPFHFHLATQPLCHNQKLTLRCPEHVAHQ